MTRDSRTLTIYIPRKLEDLRLRERLETVASREDRSLNYIILKAILAYLETEDGEAR